MAEEANMGNRIIPSLLARDLAETRDFYVKRLKFQVTGCYPNKEEPHWLEFSRDGVKLYFFDEPPLTIPDTPGLTGTLYFYPKSVAALAEELREESPSKGGLRSWITGCTSLASETPMAPISPSQNRLEGP